jgi:hypothetical protein
MSPTLDRCVFFSARTTHSADARGINRRSTPCEPADPANTVTDRLNGLLANGGEGYVLSLCPSQQYLITAPILFAAPNQEIRYAIFAHSPLLNISPMHPSAHSTTPLTTPAPLSS